METISPETTLVALCSKHIETSLSIIDDDNQPSVLILKDGRPSAKSPIILGLMEDFGAMLAMILETYSESSFYDYVYWNYVRLQSICEARGCFGYARHPQEPIINQIIPDKNICSASSQLGQKRQS